MTDPEPLWLRRFEQGQVDLTRFSHREHLRMAYELLRQDEFLDATVRYSRALRLIVGRAGKAEAFNQTVTIAFLALVAERLQGGAWPDFEAFVQAHPELLQKQTLRRWYRDERRLASDAARRNFLMPDPIA